MIEWGEVVPLSLDEAPNAHWQCAREDDGPVVKYWLPSPQEVASLETALGANLTKRQISGEQLPPTGHRYIRQYVGFSAKGQRFLCGNFFPAERWSERPLPAGRAIRVLDGGPAIWQVVFNLSSGRMEHISFSGELSSPGESHPQALPEPYVNLSIHTAPIVQSS